MVLVPDSDLLARLRLQVEVLCVVQPLIQRSLQVDEVRHPHWDKKHTQVT